MSVSLASPAPTVPQLSPTPPPFDLTWFWEGIGSTACIVLAVFLAVLFFRRLGRGEGIEPFLLVGIIVTLGFAIFWGIDGTNHLWPALRPYTVFGVLAAVVGGFFVFARASD